MVSNPVSGAWYFIRGITLLTKPGIRAYVIIPLLINILLFSAAIALGLNYFDQFLQQLQPELPQWLQWLSWLFWIFFLLIAFLIAFFTFSLLANIISAPFNGLLSEAVETHLTGAKPEQGGGWKKLSREFLSSMAAEGKKFIYFMAWSLPLLVLFLIPVVNIVAPFTWMLFSAWMLALEYLDFPMGNRGLVFPANRKRLSEQRLLSLGFGGAVMVATMIPIGNFLVIPAAVAGATAMWVERFESGKKLS